VNKYALDEVTTQVELLANNTVSTPILVSGPCRLQLYGGAANTTITIQRHPLGDNNGRTAPALNDNHWVNVQAPLTAQDLSGTKNILIDFTEPCGWVTITVTLGCTYALTATDPTKV
jgi:hypothetical protein